MKSITILICSFFIFFSVTLKNLGSGDDSKIKITISYSSHEDDNFHNSDESNILPMETETAKFKQIRVRLEGTIDDLCVGDFNNDGYSDVVILDKKLKAIRILFGDNDLKFDKRYKKQFNKIGNLIAGMADYTGNLTLDLAVEIKSDKKYLSIFPGSGKGEFKKPIFIRAKKLDGTDFKFINTLDLNGDGKPDILGIQSGSAHSIISMINNGNATFSTNKISNLLASDCLATGDFDGDKKDDFFIGDVTKGRVCFYKSNGDGTFKKGRIKNVKSLGKELYSADVNKDGKLDLIGAGGNSTNAWILYGKGNGRLAKKKYLPNNSSLLYGADIKNFIDDGSLDLAAAEPDGIRVYPGMNHRVFTKATILTSDLDYSRNGYSTSATNIGIGDFNNDGIEDIVGAQYFPESPPGLMIFANGQEPANLHVGKITYTQGEFSRGTVFLKGSFNFWGSGIDLRYDAYGSLRGSSFMEFRVIVVYSFYGRLIIDVVTTGGFLHKPESQIGTVNFDFELNTGQQLEGYTPVVVVLPITLWDCNLVKATEER